MYRVWAESLLSHGNPNEERSEGWRIKMFNEVTFYLSIDKHERAILVCLASGGVKNRLCG